MGLIMTGLVSRRSAYGVQETVEAIRKQIELRETGIVAVVDHAEAAHAVGLDMPATQVIIFGNPRVGTPLMNVAPDIAIDLPLRVLVRDDGEPGSVVSWQDPRFVADRFGLQGDEHAALTTPETVVAAALEAT